MVKNAFKQPVCSVGQRPRVYEMVNLTSSLVENLIEMDQDMEAGNDKNGCQVRQWNIFPQ